MNFEFMGFIVGVIGAIWMKASIHVLKEEGNKPRIDGLAPRQESPALKAFIKGLSLILIGLGMETVGRLFLH
ncbi:MAG: hypothetical protein HY694_14615 [Deltaproteobacteria bacterium]|nr:hypothetical protein [Deltaproteobacteria bacterium]